MTSSNHQLPSAPEPAGGHSIQAYMGHAPYISDKSEMMSLAQKLWRHKAIIIVSTALFLGLAFAASKMMTPLYWGTAEVLIGVPGSNIASAQGSVEKLIVDRETVESQGHLVASRSVAEQVVKRLGLEDEPEFNPELRPVPLWYRIKSFFTFPGSDNRDDSNPPPERKDRPFQRVISSVLNSLSVVPADRSHVLEVSAVSENPYLAARIANAFSDIYIEQQLVYKAETTQKAKAWLNDQIAALRQQVDQDERAVEDYRRQNNLYVTGSEMITTQQMGELNTQLIAAEAAKAEIDAQLGQAQAMAQSGKNAKSIPQVLASPMIQALEQKRTEVEQQAAQLSAIYGPKHPQIENIKAQISDINAKEQAQVAQIVAGLKNEQTSVHARYNTLKNSLNRSQGRVGQSNEQSIKLHELEREALASTTLFQNFLESYKQTSAQTDFQQPDAWVISHSNIPDSASYPPTTTIVVGAGIAGLLIGCLLALFAETLDRSMRTNEDVEKATGLPTLAMIPTLHAASAADHVIREPTSPFSESVRKLHTRIMLSYPGEEPPRVVMLTSSVPDEGKSLISVSMARLLAYTGRRVVIVDGDLRRPSLHTLLGQPMQAGLVDLLDGEATPDEAVYRDPVSGLHAIFAGRVPQGVGYMPDFDRLKSLLKSLARHYELVILDTPPVLVGSEAMHYARLVDTTAFVARWRHTSQDVAADAVHNIRMSGGHISGVVLARVDPKLYKKYASVDLHYNYPHRRSERGFLAKVNG